MAFELVKKKVARDQNIQTKKDKVDTKSKLKSKVEGEGFEQQSNSLKPSNSKEKKGLVSNIGSAIEKAGNFLHISTLTGKDKSGLTQEQQQELKQALSNMTLDEGIRDYMPELRAFAAEGGSASYFDFIKLVMADGHVGQEAAVYDRFLSPESEEELTITNTSLLVEIRDKAANGKHKDIDWQRVLKTAKRDANMLFGEWKMNRAESAVRKKMFGK